MVSDIECLHITVEKSLMPEELKKENVLPFVLEDNTQILL